MSERSELVAGIWDLAIATPIGTIAVALHLADSNGSIIGNARGNDETVPLVDATLTGNRLTWKQSIRKPIRLNLAFDVVFDGDSLAGVSKAGMLPASRVTGKRRSLS